MISLKEHGNIHGSKISSQFFSRVKNIQPWIPGDFEALNFLLGKS